MKKVNESGRMVTGNERRRVLALYHEDNHMPTKIHRMTGIPLETIKKIVYRKPK